MKWGGQYPFAFPLWFGPSLSILNIHHPSYVKTLLTTTGAHPVGTFKIYITFSNINNQNQHFTCFFLALFTEPKDDYAYKFFIPWLGKITHKAENYFFIIYTIRFIVGCFFNYGQVCPCGFWGNKLKDSFLSL